MTLLFLLSFSIIGAIIAVIVGTFWYSNSTPMGRLHMRYLGFDKLTEKEKKKMMKEGKAMMPKMYVGQIALSLLTSFAVVFVVAESIQYNVPVTLAIGFVVFNWFTFMVPIIGQGILWGTCDPKIAWQKFFSDIFSNLVTVVLIALLVSIFA